MFDRKTASLYELADRFEKDIVYACHSLSLRISRSEAGKELIRRGNSAITLVRERTSRGDNSEIQRAWNQLHVRMVDGPDCDMVSGPCACGAWHFPKIVSQ